MSDEGKEIRAEVKEDTGTGRQVFISINEKHYVIDCYCCFERQEPTKKEAELIASRINTDVEKVGYKIRRHLWFSHGHQGIYGDDGEMQCSECGLDYKRDDLEKVVDKAIEVIENNNMIKLSKQQNMEKVVRGMEKETKIVSYKGNEHEVSRWDWDTLEEVLKRIGGNNGK